MSEFVIICADMNSLLPPDLTPVSGSSLGKCHENLTELTPSGGRAGGGAVGSTVNLATNTVTRSLETAAGVTAVLMTLKRVTLSVLEDCLYVIPGQLWTR